MRPADGGERDGAGKRAALPHIKGYRIEGVLGRGSTGVVYSGVQLAVDRPVAIKVLHPDLVGTKRAVRRLQREARTAARLAHPGIISAIDMGQEGSLWWYAMELVEGISLAERIQERGTLSEREALRLFIPLCDALQHVFEGGVVHRDIKPANILIDPSGRARLVDLGLAFAENDPLLTRPGGTLGTPHYISPEQARDPAAADQRSDIWSLGASLYHALCGRPPFQGESVAEILSGVLYHRIPDPRRANPQLSRGMALVLRKCLSRDRDHRYQEPAALLRDLELLRERRSPTVKAAQLDPVAQAPSGRLVRASKGLLLLAVIGIPLLLWASSFFGPTRLSEEAAAPERMAWPEFERLERAYARGALSFAEAFADLEVLPSPPSGWEAQAPVFEERLLEQLDERLAVVRERATAALELLVEEHGFARAGAYLDSELPAQLEAHTGWRELRELPAGRLRSGYKTWLERQRAAVESGRRGALALATATLRMHFREITLPQFEEHLTANRWRSALELIEPDRSLLERAQVDQRGLTEADLEEVFASVRFDVSARRQSAQIHFNRLDASLCEFLRDEAQRLAQETGHEQSRQPDQLLRGALQAERERLGLDEQQVPVSWLSEHGRRVGSAALIDDLALSLLHTQSEALELLAREQLETDRAWALEAARDRRYGEIVARWEQRLQDAWREPVRKQMSRLGGEAQLLLGLLQRSAAGIRARRGERISLTFSNIPYPDALIGTAEGAIERGFELRPQGLPAFRVHLVRVPSMAHGSKLLGARDLLRFAGLAQPTKSIDDELLSGRFLLHEGLIEEAAKRLSGLSGVPGTREQDDVLRELQSRVEAEAESQGRRLRSRTLAKVQALEGIRAQGEQSSTAAGLLEEITSVSAQYADLLTAAEREELESLRSARRLQREPTALERAYRPTSVEKAGQSGVRMTFAFQQGLPSAWRLGAWNGVGPGVRQMVPRRTTQEFWAAAGALRLPLVAPLDLSRPLTVTLTLSDGLRGGGLGNELVVSVAGVHVVFVDAPGAPSVNIGRGELVFAEGAQGQPERPDPVGPVALLRRARQGRVPGFDGFGGFPVGGEAFDLVIRLDAAQGVVQVQVGEQRLDLQPIKRSPLPERCELSLRSREPLEVLGVSLEGTRTTGGR